MGAPKKFSTDFEERKISWLELFYDLIYVIAIATITHHVSEHLNFAGMLDFLFVHHDFWGWLNGSLYHDLQWNNRTADKIDDLMANDDCSGSCYYAKHFHDKFIFNSTIVVMIMHNFTLPIYGGVGIYDKAHRKLNVPIYGFVFTFSGINVCFFVVEQKYVDRYFILRLCWITCLRLLHKQAKEKPWSWIFSSSMTERLGLFTIIIFGEVVLEWSVVQNHWMNWMVWSG